MWGGRVVLAVAATAVLSGCAHSRVRQDMSRLQQQMGIIDERVTQLERTSLSGFSTGSTTGPVETGSTATEPNPSPMRHARTGTATTASTASIKPSTREIQKALKNAGFYQASVDGKMGPQTRAAVKEFQRVHGLHDDGIVGRQTWSKLRAYVDLAETGGDVHAAEPLK